MKTAREKIRISFDIKTFLVIITSVGSISFWGANIISKLDNVELAQKEIKRDIKDVYACQQETEKKIAWLEPTVQMILKKLGL